MLDPGVVMKYVGMLLSVALTILVKLLLESGENTKPLALLLGPNPDEPPPVKPAK